MLAEWTTESGAFQVVPKWTKSSTAIGTWLNLFVPFRTIAFPEIRVASGYPNGG